MNLRRSVQSAALLLALGTLVGHVLAQESSMRAASTSDAARVTYHTTQVDG